MSKLGKGQKSGKGGATDLKTGVDDMRQVYDEHMHLVNVDMRVAWNKEKGSFVELDSWKRIIHVHEDALFALEKLIVGDYVVMVNGKVWANEKEMQNAFSEEKKCSVVVLRRYNTAAVPLKRAIAVGLVRKPNFIYMVVTVEPQKCDIGKRLGMVLMFKPRAFFVCQVQPDALVADIFQIGDAIRDLDCTPIPVDDPFFIKHFPFALEKNGGFSVIVERPLNGEIVPIILHEIQGNVKPDRPMAPDAVLIGTNAAKEYRAKVKSFAPKSILKEWKVQSPASKTDKDKEFEWKKNQEFDIGTDVKECTKLRQVERDEKDQTKKKRRPRVFEDFYDVL